MLNFFPFFHNFLGLHINISPSLPFLNRRIYRAVRQSVLAALPSPAQPASAAHTCGALPCFTRAPLLSIPPAVSLPARHHEIKFRCVSVPSFVSKQIFYIYKKYTYYTVQAYMKNTSYTFVSTSSLFIFLVSSSRRLNEHFLSQFCLNTQAGRAGHNRTPKPQLKVSVAWWCVAWGVGRCKMSRKGNDGNSFPCW